jgi:hypothetical protein
MEELIWKYIDGDCTREETLEVERLLKTDETFKNDYEQCFTMHQQLIATSKVDLSLDFHKALTLQVADFVQSQKIKPTFKALSFTQILPIPAVAMIVSVTIASIVVLSKNQVFESNYLQYIPEIGDTYITYATWSMAGFLLLYFADVLLSQMRLNKTNKGMMMV